jgi:hypothetical protein
VTRITSLGVFETDIKKHVSPTPIMNAARIAILTALLATSVSAEDLRDRIRSAGTLFETESAREYTVKFLSPPLGANAAYATYTRTDEGLESITYTLLRRLPNGFHQVTAIVDHDADTHPDVVFKSTGQTLRDAYARMADPRTASEPDDDAAEAYERCVRSLLAPRNAIMAAR